MSKRVDSIIKQLKEELEERKKMINRHENSIKVLSNECTERLDIIKKIGGGR